MPYNIDSLRQACQAADSNAEKIVYSTDASAIKGETISIAWPSNMDELQKLMRVVTRERISITLRGGGTSLVGGAVPQNSLVIDMSRMNKIKLVDHENKFAVVEAGVVLDDLNNALAHHELEFPVQPGSHAACTIGGMIATNAAGMLSSKFGRTENWLLGMTIMDGTGKVFNLDSVEAKEFIGTEGCCAIIVDAKIKLTDKNNNTSTDVFTFNNLNELMSKVDELKNENDAISVEFVNKAASKLADMKSKYYLIVKYSTSKGKLTSEDDVWKTRENMYSIMVSNGYERIEDPQIEGNENIIKFLEWLEQRDIPCYGHIATGILHPHFKRDQKEINDMFEFLKQVNGKAVSEHGIGILKKKYAPFAFAQKIKILKERYDPFNILNKGKII